MGVPIWIFHCGVTPNRTARNKEVGALRVPEDFITVNLRPRILNAGPEAKRLDKE